MDKIMNGLNDSNLSTQTELSVRYISNNINSLHLLKPNDGNALLIPGLQRVGRDLTAKEYLDEIMINHPTDAEKVVRGPWYNSTHRAQIYFNEVKNEVLRRAQVTGQRLVITEQGPWFDIKVTCIGIFYNRYVANELQFLEGEESVLVVPKMTYSPSERTTIYNEAKKQRLHITVTDIGDSYEVTTRDPELRARGTCAQYDSKTVFMMFTSDMDYDKPVTFPEEFVRKTSDAYIRLMCTQSPYELSYRRGYITKHRYRLCNVDGGVSIRTNGQTLTRLENVKTSTLSPQQIALLNMRMLPYGVTVTDDKELRYDHD